MRKLLIVLAAVVALGVLALAMGLFAAHRHIRGLDPPLPEAAALARFDPDAELPVRLRFLNTASQKMPRAGVLEPDLDPDSDAPYVMSHPAFALEWADGRLFLIDLGMDRAAAQAFGRNLERLAGGDPIEPLGSVAAQLDGAVHRIAGVAFTHLHTDHTTGIAALCAAVKRSIPVFQLRLQAEEANFTTRAGRAQLEAAPCVERRVLEGEGLVGVPGFPGLGVLAAAGHTPGSQVFVAHVRSADGVSGYVFAGDAANQIDGIRSNLPKPRLYSLFVVPESTARLERLRLFIAALERERGLAPLVSHDQLHLEASGVLAWGS